MYALITMFLYTAQCINQEVRVVDGPSDGEGRAEVCINSVYYQICDDGWSQNDAKVFCNKLGFSVFGELTCCIGCEIACLNGI